MRNEDTYLTDNHPTTFSDTIPKGTTRRKLPKTPHELCKKSVSGKIQLQIWFRKNKNDLVVNVLDARSLRMRSDNTLPRAYVKVRLLPV
uniref:C2 domain-containing protein n=1 Tax=Strigamia maritima TaxID=126957 RepID=T1JP61_STRMM